MKTFSRLRTWCQKFVSGLTSLAIILSMMPIQPTYAVGSVSINYNLPAVQGLTDNQFHANLLFNGQVIAGGNGNSTFSNLPDANYTVEVDILAQGYIVNNNPHPIPVTVSGGAATVNIDIIADPGQQPPATGAVNVTYNLPAVQGLTDNQFNANLETSGGQVVASGNGASTFSNIPAGAYQVNVNTLPQGYLVNNNPHPIPVTVVGGQTASVVVDILVDPNNPPPGLTGVVSVTYNLPAVQGLTDNQFSANLETTGGQVVASGNGASTFSNIPAGNFQVNVTTLPQGYLVGNNPHPVPVTVVAGQTNNVVIDILVDPNNPPPGASGTIAISYNLPNIQGLTDNQFSANLETTGGQVVASGNGASSFGNIPAGNYQINVTSLPAGFVVGNNPHPIPVTAVIGQTVNVVIDILIDPNVGGTGEVEVIYQLPNGSGLTDNQFNHNLDTNPGGATIASGNGDSVMSNLPAGDYTLNVNTIPAGFRVSNNPHPIPVTVLAGNRTTVIVNIVANGAQTVGHIAVTFTAPIGTNVSAVEHTLTGPNNFTQTLTGNAVYNDLVPGNYTLTVNQATLPAGLQIQGGTNVFAITAVVDQTVTQNIVLEPIQAPNTGDVAVQFTTPNGVNANTIEHTLTQDNGPFTNTLLGNSVYNSLNVDGYTLTVNQATIPAGFQIQGGANIFTTTVIAGQTVTITVVIEPLQAPNTGDIAVQFNAPNGVNVAAISHTLNQDNGPFTNTLTGNAVYSALNVDSYTLTVDTNTLPAGFQIQGGINTFNATVIAGQTVTITITLVPIANTGDVAVQFNAPVGVNVAAIEHTLTEDAGPFTGTLLGNNVYQALTVGNYTLTVNVATIPAGHQIQGGTNTFGTTVTAGNTSTITITIIPIAGNNLPAISFTQGGNNVVAITATAGVAITPVVVTATDADAADNLTLSLQTNPIPSGAGAFTTVTGLSPISGNYTLTAAVGDVGGPYNVVFRVNDGTVDIDVILSVTVVAGPQTPGFTVTPQNVQVTENGTVATYAISTNTVPTADVNVSVVSNDITEGTVSPAFLTFTPANGTNPLQVTITGVDDAINDGNVIFIVQNQPATSADNNYNGLDPADVTVTNVDNDVGPGGGGGGGRRFGQPEITFLFNGQEVSQISVPANANFSVEVIAKTTRYSTDLKLKEDPSNGTASLQIAGENPSIEVNGVLSWRPGQDFVGSHAFIFRSDNLRNDNFDEKTLTINVTGPSSGGGGGGGGGFSTGGFGTDQPEDPLKDCRYADNETESVIFLCMLGIIDGPSTDDLFSGRSKNNRYFGNEPITRAAFTKIMINLVYEYGDIQKVNNLISENEFYAFPDVEPAAWFAPYISVGKLDNHVHGYPDNGNFIPWNNIEVSEAVKILFNSARHDNDKVANDLLAAQKDVGDSAWFMPYALLCYAYGGFVPDMGVDPGIVYSKQLSRQQAADIIYTTILNAGIEPKSKLSALKEEVARIKIEANLAEQALVEEVSAPVEVPSEPVETPVEPEEAIAAPEQEDPREEELEIIIPSEPIIPQYEPVITPEEPTESFEEDPNSSLKDRIKRRIKGTPILF